MFHDSQAVRMRRGRTAWGAALPIAFLIFVMLAVVRSTHAEDCADLLVRFGSYERKTQAAGGDLFAFIENGKTVIYRYDESGRKIRLLTETQENRECLKAAKIFTPSALRSTARDVARTSRQARNLRAQSSFVFEARAFDIADLNGDGVNDSVGVGTGDVIYVFRGNSTDEMASAGSFPVGGTPQKVLLADLNGDARQDAVVIRGGSPGGLSVLLGNGNLTFQAAAPSPAGNNPVALASGDFNKDGKLDLAVAFQGDFSTATSAGVAVLLGKGDGSFQAPASFAAANGVSALLAADFTGDGNLDLVLGNNQTNTVTVFPGNGAGAFGAGVDTSIGAGPEYLAAMDLNQDSKADLVAQLTILNGLSVLLNNGNGSFQEPVILAAGNDASSFVALDLNGDGSETVFYVPGVGTDLTIVGYASDGRIAGQPMVAAPPQLYDITTADFNKDGKPDIAAVGPGNADGDIITLLSQPGSNGFTRGPEFRLGGSLFAAAGGDFDGDGNPDLTVAPNSQPAQLRLLRGDGTGALANPINTPLPGAAYNLAAADFNADGRTDVAVSVRRSSGPGNVSIFLGGAAGTFASAGSLNAGNRPLFAAAGDLNGDGRQDLAVVDEGTFASTSDPGGIFVFLGNGDGTFPVGVRYEGGLNPSSVAIGDVNGDGLPDLAITTNAPNFEFRVGVLPATGGGAFGPPMLKSVEFGPKHVVVDDFNQDGKNDLVVVHCCGDVSPALLLGNGDGTFADEEPFAAPGDAARVAVGRFNGDNFPDLAIGSAANINTGGVLAVMFNLLAPATQQQVTSVNGAGFQPDEAVAPDSIVSGFGSGLATGTLIASALPLPTDLLGTSVTVTDSQGVARDASLFAVTPGQVNFMMPADTATGVATVTVHSGAGGDLIGAVQVASVGPGIFQALPTNFAVGSALRVQPGNVRTETQLVGFENGQFVAMPVNMGDAADEVFLSLYATGIRRRNKQNAVMATVGGEAAIVEYADAQMQFVGLDQIVLRVPHSLAGRGLVNIVITVDGKTANAVRVHFQ